MQAERGRIKNTFDPASCKMLFQRDYVIYASTAVDFPLFYIKNNT